MRYDIRIAGDHMRAELFDRETGEETRSFLKALASAVLAHRMERVLIQVRASRPIFKVEQYQASAYLKALASRPALKVALLSVRDDVRAAHEYLEVLAGQQGANLRSFSHEAMALEWLRTYAPTGAPRRQPGAVKLP